MRKLSKRNCQKISAGSPIGAVTNFAYIFTGTMAGIGLGHLSSDLCVPADYGVKNYVQDYAVYHKLGGFDINGVSDLKCMTIGGLIGQGLSILLAGHNLTR